MTKRKIIFITVIFAVVLTGFRLLWVSYHTPPEHPHAVKGILDLQNWDFKKDNTITLDGQWELFPGQLLPPEGSDAPVGDLNKKIVQVPGVWDKSFSDERKSSYGYGTYRLQIQIDTLKEQTYGIHVHNIRGASELFVNGRLLAGSGHPANTREQQTMRNIPYTAFFTPTDGRIEIMLRISNFDYASRGGIVNSITFGTAKAVEHENIFSIGTSLVVGIVLLLHAFYSAILYLFQPRHKGLIYFSLFVVCSAITVFTNFEKLLLISISFNFEWMIRFQYLCYIGTAAFMVLFTKHLFPEYGKHTIIRWFSVLCGLFALFILISPAQYTTLTEPLLLLFNLIPSLVVPVIWMRGALKGKEDAIYMLLAATAITSHVVWGILNFSGLFATAYYPFDIIASFLSIASYWFKRFFRATKQTEQLMAQLQKADKQKDDFLANTSHELRNPLHGILNIAQTIVDTEKNSLQHKTLMDLELLISVGRRMSFTLNDLLDLTRLKEHEVQLNMTNLRIQSVASGVLDMLRFMTEGKQIRLMLNIPDSFPEVTADENRLVQILFNLLHNAVKYTHEGHITISAEKQDGKAYIHITDSGIGMDEETRQRIFLPYEQGDSSMTALGNGLGLGLSISSRLVELHSGKLEAASTLGQGSVFTFTLPLSGRIDQETTPGLEKSIPSTVYSEIAATVISSVKEPIPASPSTSEKPRVLVVDDDPVNLQIMDNLLSAEQYDIITLRSGREAVARLDAELWDLVITDVMMPHMSGYELTRIIRERFSISELPVLLLTARSRPEDVSAGFLSGANDYVTKPVNALELKSRVRALTNLQHSFTERLRLEAAWLQAQIKPHFLFNALNSIAALSEIDTERMRNLLHVFGDYLRTSFDFRNLERFVPLQHELGLVRSYLFIEKVRFEDRLEVIWDCDESINVQLPPLSIQPLVENAVRHGIMRRSRGGSVCIRITENMAYTVISVEDNGVGIAPERMDDLLHGKPHENKGIGLYNLNRRLKQNFGKGLQIQSVPNQGTSVTFKIPK